MLTRVPGSIPLTTATFCSAQLAQAYECITEQQVAMQKKNSFNVDDADADIQVEKIRITVITFKFGSARRSSSSRCSPTVCASVAASSNDAQRRSIAN